MDDPNQAVNDAIRRAADPEDIGDAILLFERGIVTSDPARVRRVLEAADAVGAKFHVPELDVWT